MITSLSAFSYFLVVFLMSSNYVIPGSMVREFLILDNWKEVILDIKFFFYHSLISFLISLYLGEYFPTVFQKFIEWFENIEMNR